MRSSSCTAGLIGADGRLLLQLYPADCTLCPSVPIVTRISAWCLRAAASCFDNAAEASAAASACNPAYKMARAIRTASKAAYSTVTLVPVKAHQLVLWEPLQKPHASLPCLAHEQQLCARLAALSSLPCVYQNLLNYVHVQRRLKAHSTESSVPFTKCTVLYALGPHGPLQEAATGVIHTQVIKKRVWRVLVNVQAPDTSNIVIPKLVTA